MNEFLDMGGYAKYVWGTYSISLIVLTLTVMLCKRTLTNTRNRVLRRQASFKESPS